MGVFLKISFILTFVLLFQSSINAGVFPSGGMSGGFPSGGLYSGATPEVLKIEDNPKISVKIDNNISLSCDLDKNSKTYICPNDGHPVLVKYSSLGFVALTRDEKNHPKMPAINHIESKGKTLFEAPDLSAYPGWGPSNGFGAGGLFSKTEDLKSEYISKVMYIDSFFETFSSPGMKMPERKTGSPEYEPIAQSFLTEKEQLQDLIKKTSHEKNYSVELSNGQKINCERGNTRPPTEQIKEYLKQMGVILQCGSFKCESVQVDGKNYNATMLFDSSEGSLSLGSIHLTDTDGIGPKVSIKKIVSPLLQIPLLDNTEWLANAGKSFNADYLASMLPVSLKEDREKIAQYKDPYFEQMINFYQSICSDDNNMTALLEGKKKLVAKLAELDLAEFIQVLDNGSLVGQFVDPTLAPQLGCLYQGVYLNEEAAKNLERLKKNIHPDRHVEQTISLARATELFTKATKMDDIAWNYKPDGCYARAHLMARRFEAEGVRVDKVWIKGDLYVPGTEPLIQWNFHVAPIVYVDDGKGVIQKMVIDPSLFSKPVTVEEWDHKMSKKTAKGSVIAAFPFPENSAFMERSTLSFSSSDPYLPRDSISMSEQEKMQQSNETMRMYKPMESK